MTDGTFGDLIRCGGLDKDEDSLLVYEGSILSRHNPLSR